jgi:predicted DNA-binding protein YlxM (UPF0122 family)
MLAEIARELKASRQSVHGYVKVEVSKRGGFGQGLELGQKRLGQEGQTQESVEKQEGKGGRRRSIP